MTYYLRGWRLKSLHIFPPVAKALRVSKLPIFFEMKITFREWGGFAGLIQGCEIDTDLLSASEVSELQSLLEQSGILQVKSQCTAEARDLCNYEITLETSEKTIRVLFDDMTLPESAEKLLEHLQQQAQPLPPS